MSALGVSLGSQKEAPTLSYVSLPSNQALSSETAVDFTRLILYLQISIGRAVSLCHLPSCRGSPLEVSYYHYKGRTSSISCCIRIADGDIASLITENSQVP